MTLPKPGARVRVWPLHPRVQADAQPVSAKHSGRFMSDEGHDVIWSPFHVALLRGGAICLHDPKHALDVGEKEDGEKSAEPHQEAIAARVSEQQLEHGAAPEHSAAAEHASPEVTKAVE